MKTVEFEISNDDGVTLTCVTKKYQANAALHLLPRLLQLIGPAFSDGDFANALPALGTALSSLSPSEMDKLLLQILSSTNVIFVDENGNKKALDLNSIANINRVFDADVSMIFEVIGEVLKANFARFLAGPKAASQAVAG